MELKDNIVIVLDLSSYADTEEVPFKAKVTDKFEDELIVVSLVTKKRYNLYYWQILESLSSADIRKLINISEFQKGDSETGD